MKPVVLTIAGSDSGGGAGIQADLRTFSACGAYGATAITCLTAQNPGSVTQVMPVEPDFLREQILQVDRFFRVAAAKTGMLYSAELVAVAVEFLQDRPDLPAVVDPVMVASSGARLLAPAAVQAVKEQLLPLARLVTPNLDEAGVLLGRTPAAAEMEEAAVALAEQIGTKVLLKGGHLPGDVLIDVLAEPGGIIETFRDVRIDGINTHGSGCTLASAIAAHLAQGTGMTAAVAAGRRYLREAMLEAIPLSGQRFIDHEARPSIR